jgi:hypothetical protein
VSIVDSATDDMLKSASEVSLIVQSHTDDKRPLSLSGDTRSFHPVGILRRCHEFTPV